MDCDKRVDKQTIYIFEQIDTNEKCFIVEINLQPQSQNQKCNTTQYNINGVETDNGDGLSPLTKRKLSRAFQTICSAELNNVLMLY